MNPIRINSVSLQGFRSFGKAKQSVGLSPTVSVFWGGNSQGKTSLAEAFEFLLTGQIARREMLASAKDEFSEALRNAHVVAALPTVVEAEISCHDGVVRKVSRTLVHDYQRGSAAGCTTRLEIDGVPAREADLHTVIGIRLSHEPLRAPVLAQHTLGYLFSASPTDRATYFRAVLDTQELEDFRNSVAGLSGQLKAPTSQILDDLGSVRKMTSIAVEAAALALATSLDGVKAGLSACCTELLAGAETGTVTTLAEQCATIEAELARRRSLAFPVELFAFQPLVRWNGDSGKTSELAKSFLEERAKVDAETQRLVVLFKAALALPDHTHDSDQDCPLCGAEKSLTVDRVEFIKTQIKATQSYTEAEAAFIASLKEADALLVALGASLGIAMPAFMKKRAAARKKLGFTVSAVKRLTADDDLVTSWLRGTRGLWRSGRALRRAVSAARQGIQDAVSNVAEWSASGPLAQLCADVLERQIDFEQEAVTYGTLSVALLAKLNLSVDQSSSLEGWDSLIRLAGQPDTLWSDMRASRAHAKKLKDLEKALAEIDAANGKVADQKFTELSSGVRDWWELLRPDEATFFDGVQRRSSKSRRIIDLKVGLSVAEDRSNPKVRDAVAVLSQSQLHCLGLSIFLARAIKEGTGFIILDDPVLSSDDDYRPNFTSSVLEALGRAGVQVIITTQDHASWKDIGHRWEHNGAIQLQLIRADPLLGTEIRSQGDALATMIAKAAPMVKSHDPLIRKEGAQRVREAIERFAKMIVVQQRIADGETLASITDYDGKNFSEFGPAAMTLLKRDPSHRGKLRAAHSYLTPGPHDDTPPSQGELKTAFGDLKALKSEYLP